MHQVVRSAALLAVTTAVGVPFGAEAEAEAAEASAATVLWNGAGGLTAAETFVAETGGQMLNLGLGASISEVEAESLNLVNSATGDIEVFQQVSIADGPFTPIE